LRLECLELVQRWRGRTEERPRVDATALVAGRDLNVGHQIRVEAIVERHAPVDPVALELVGNIEQTGKCAVRRLYWVERVERIHRHAGGQGAVRVPPEVRVL